MYKTRKRALLARTSHSSLQYDSLYQENSPHTGEISKQVGCNAAYEWKIRFCNCDRGMRHDVYVCLCKQLSVGMGTGACMCVCYLPFTLH